MTKPDPFDILLKNMVNVLKKVDNHCLHKEIIICIKVKLRSG